MQWYSNLYIGEQARKRKYKIIWKVKHYAIINAYLLIFPSNPDNLLDIIHANYLLQPYYRKQNIKIVGIAATHEEALKVLEYIVQNIYDETGAIHVKDYIVNRQNKKKTKLWQV